MDLLILKALSGKQRYRSLVHAVPQGMVESTTQIMLQWFRVYFETFPEREYIQPDELASLVRLRSGGADEASVACTLHLVQQLHSHVDEASINGILGQLHELDLAGRAGALLSKYNNGEEVQLAYELNKLSNETVRSISASAPTDYIDTPIEELLADISDDKGIKFRRIALLRDHIGGLQGGASVAIGARPDKGKTTLIANTVTDFAPQCLEFFGPGRPILWLNNEGSGRRIKPRLYQAALQIDVAEMIAMSNAGTLRQAYADAVQWDDMIRVKDMHGASLAQIEQVVEAMNPCVVIADMLANFRLPGVGNGNKADAIEQLWQQWREMMVRHDCIGLATVQISAEGGNMLYPPYSAMKDSKTAIQGATDVIIMMGSLDNPDAQTLRGLSTPKNKFALPGKPSFAQGEVYMDASRCVFDDGTTGAVAPGRQ